MNQMLRLVALGLVLAVAVLPVTGRGTSAAGATPGVGCPTTAPAANADLVRQWYEVGWNQPDFSVVGGLLAEDVTFALGDRPGAEPVGADAAVARIRELRTVDFPDIRVTVEATVAQGDLVAVRLLSTGTHSDALEEHPDFTTEPTGTSVTWSGIAMYRIACGRIAEGWGSEDTYGLLQQVGAIATAGGGTPPAVAIPTVPGAGVDATPADCRVTTPEENAALVERVYDEVWNGRDLDILDDLYAPDHVLHTANRHTVVGDDGERAVVAALLREWPDYQVPIDAIVAEGDLVAVRYTGTGTEEGASERFGVSADGRQITVDGMAIYRVACGRIAETWRNHDELDLYRQVTGGTATPAP